MSQREIVAFGVRRTLENCSNFVDRVSCAVGTAALVAFAGVMLVGVFFRYVLNDSLMWSDELASILFGWSVFLFVSSAYLHDQHLNVDVLVRRLRGKCRRVADVVAQGLIGGYLLSLLFSSIEAWNVVSRAKTDALQLPTTIHFLAIPVAAILMLIHWARRNVEARDVVGKLLVALCIVSLASLPIGGHVTIIGWPKFFTIFVIFALPTLLGVPIAIVLGMVATIYLSLDRFAPFSTGALQIFNSANVFMLVAIPLLIFSGKLMHSTGIARRLIDFSMSVVGRLRGGLGASNVLASFLFGDISGSAVSDTAAIGTVMIPEMKRRGYKDSFCAALQGSAGTLGMTAPLSITVLLYAGATNSSVTRLASAMLIPSLLLVVSFIAYVVFHAYRHGYPTESVPRGLFLKRLFGAGPGLFALVLVIGGILGGVFTPAEVGAILLAYVLVLGILVYRSLKPRVFYESCIEAGHISGMTIFMVCTSGFLGYVLARDMVSFEVAQFVGEITTNRYITLLALSVIFLLLGMILEPPAMIFGFLPTFLPLLAQSEIDLIHWGVLLAVNAGIGCILPPVALNLFVATKLAGISYDQAIRSVAPFILVMLLDMALIAILPEIALFLPHVLFEHPLN